MQNARNHTGTVRCHHTFPHCLEKGMNVIPAVESAFFNPSVTCSTDRMIAGMEDWSVAGVLDAFKIVLHNDAAMMIDNKEIVMCENEETLHTALFGGDWPDENVYRCALPCNFSALQRCVSASFSTFTGNADALPLPRKI